ncbi:unnamed protein product [Acanthosepion pharaonis]|uniref:Uncharacterized protein n=1 Tax=Acanthosepion pharaonis TaxID=158019 RepID=A0A812CLC2_ACAPH|nr:unnamed protein product [Sepia pharaonis]
MFIHLLSLKFFFLGFIQSHTLSNLFLFLSLVLLLLSTFSFLFTYLHSPYLHFPSFFTIKCYLPSISVSLSLFLSLSLSLSVSLCLSLSLSFYCSLVPLIDAVKQKLLLMISFFLSFFLSFFFSFFFFSFIPILCSLLNTPYSKLLTFQSQLVPTRCVFDHCTVSFLLPSPNICVPIIPDTHRNLQTSFQAYPSFLVLSLISYFSFFLSVFLSFCLTLSALRPPGLPTCSFVGLSERSFVRSSAALFGYSDVFHTPPLLFTPAQ